MKSLRLDLLTSHRFPPLRGELFWVYHGQPVYPAERQDAFETPTSIFFVEQGSVSLRWKGGTVLCRPGDLFLSRLGPRWQMFAPETRLLSIGYDFSWSSERPVFDEGLNRHVLAAQARRGSCGKLRQASLELSRKMGRRSGHDNFHEAIHDDPVDLQTHADRHAAFWEWVRVLVGTCEDLGIPAALPLAKDPVVRRVKSRIEQHPLDRPFLPQLLVVDIGVGWRRVQQLFQSEMHVSPSDYFEKRRLYHARVRLKQPDVPVKVVAAELGFQTLSHFSVWFKRHFGRSPRLFARGDLKKL